jgi:F-type H+-transporting ATPase subunit a
MTLRSFRWKKYALLTPALLLAATTPAFGAEGVAPQASELFSVGGVSITNSMVTTWFFSLMLILLVRWASGRPQLVPSRGQAVVESILTGLRDIFETIVGKRMIDKVFPLLISLFIFILIMNWSGLLPGAGSIGMVDAGGDFTTIFRPADSDLNTTLGLAIISFVAWLYFVLRYAGLGALVKDIFGNKADKKEVHILLYFALSPIFFLVGFVEIISILSRLLSLSFRLYGNVFGGESLLDAMYNICPYLLPVIFYFMEIMVGIVQAFVFVVLTAVYIGLICNHEGGDHDHAEDGHAADTHGETKAASSH